MFEDVDIQLAADDFVSSRYSSEFVAVRSFELKRPSGVYFFARHTDAVKRNESPSRISPIGVVGDAGFFVDRLTGGIRSFAPLELAVGAEAFKELHGRCRFPQDLPRLVAHLLTVPE